VAVMAKKPHRICLKVKDYNGEERWNQIGVAFPGDKGISLIFNARILVAPGDAIMVFPPFKDRDEGTDFNPEEYEDGDLG